MSKTSVTSNNMDSTKLLSDSHFATGFLPQEEYYTNMGLTDQEENELYNLDVGIKNKSFTGELKRQMLRKNIHTTFGMAVVHNVLSRISSVEIGSYMRRYIINNMRDPADIFTDIMINFDVKYWEIVLYNLDILCSLTLIYKKLKEDREMTPSRVILKYKEYFDMVVAHSRSCDGHGDKENVCIKFDTCSVYLHVLRVMDGVKE